MGSEARGFGYGLFGEPSSTVNVQTKPERTRQPEALNANIKTLIELHACRVHGLGDFTKELHRNYRAV